MQSSNSPKVDDTFSTAILPGTSSTIINDARDGKIIHLKQPEAFNSLFSYLQLAFHESLSINDLLKSLTWEQLVLQLDTVVGGLDQSKEHYKLLCSLLERMGVQGENILDTTLDKSLRLCLKDQGRKNYGYFIHRDSWFDLAPDGVNIVIYLSDVPYYGNTIFFPSYFGKEIPYDPSTRRIIGDETDLGSIQVHECKAGDVLIFAGDQLHGGALVDTNRFSIEFRLSRSTTFGRASEGILYRSASYFKEF